MNDQLLELIKKNARFLIRDSRHLRRGGRCRHCLKTVDMLNPTGFMRVYTPMKTIQGRGEFMRIVPVLPVNLGGRIHMALRHPDKVSDEYVRQVFDGIYTIQKAMTENYYVLNTDRIPANYYLMPKLPVTAIGAVFHIPSLMPINNPETVYHWVLKEGAYYLQRAVVMREAKDDVASES